MGFDFIKKLPTPEEIRNQYPIDAEIQAVKDARDKELRDVFTGKSDKFLAIIGPCSADNEDAVLDYLTRLRNVQEKIADKVLIVPRVYTNKPRTTGEGYKGMVHQPDPEKQPNLLAGLVAIRKMHIHAIRTSGMTCADEMLYPENYRYLSDLLSYQNVDRAEHVLCPTKFPVIDQIGDVQVAVELADGAAQHGFAFERLSFAGFGQTTHAAFQALDGILGKGDFASPDFESEEREPCARVDGHAVGLRTVRTGSRGKSGIKQGAGARDAESRGNVRREGCPSWTRETGMASRRSCRKKRKWCGVSTACSLKGKHPMASSRCWKQSISPRPPGSKRGSRRPF